MKIKIINQSNNPLPRYETEGSSGMDIRANLEKELTLGSLERSLIPTGLYLEIPRGFEVQIRPRSGLSIKHGITLINAIGTIDSDYRGELKIPLVNLSNEEYTIGKSERICQMVVLEIHQVELEEVESLSETKRADGGFGSTGS